VPTIAQLTDLHLSADPEARFRGLDPWACLDALLGELAGRDEAIDLLVFTGDIAHDERAETYVLLRERLGPWLARSRVIPGNHDDPAAIRETFPAPARLTEESATFIEELGAHGVIGLDTHVPGAVHGALDEGQLDALEEALGRGLPTVVFLHHQPTPVGSKWIDHSMLKNADNLAARLAAGRVELICHGHTHQEVEGTLAGVRVVGTPSTAAQFKPGSLLPLLDRGAAPGLRLIRLEDDGVRSEVLRCDAPELRTVGRVAVGR